MSGYGYDHQNTSEVKKTDKEEKILSQYKSLNSLSDRYFFGLRDLLETGKRKLWEPYFRKAFETFTQLWKFQLEHRAVLEKNGLKRYEIGFIASRIGQLYYLYYLRTGDMRCLHESFRFYEAIHTRAYFKNMDLEEVLVNSMLRYYARFIVVCLFLNKRQLINDILPEFSDSINLYLTNFNIADKGEQWSLVLEELENFLKAETKVTIDQSMDLIQYRSNSTPVLKSKHKKSQSIQKSNNGIPNYLYEAQSKSGNTTPSSEDSSSPSDNSIEDTIFSQPQYNAIKLTDAILVTSRKVTVKFSELSLDVLRIMQSLEKNSVSEKQSAIRKQMLYRPSCSDLLVHLANTLDSELTSDLPSTTNATFLYISADSSRFGIILDNKRRGTTYFSENDEADTNLLDSNCFTIQDIIPFTRKPLFMIFESENTASLIPQDQVVHSYFVSLFSPKIYISQIQDSSTTGSFFTYFLTSPILAFSFLAGVKNLEGRTFRDCELFIQNSFNELYKLLSQDEHLDVSMKVFLENENTRSYILRFMLCHVTMRLFIEKNLLLEFDENSEQKKDYLPSSCPPINCLNSETSSETTLLIKIISQLVEKLVIDDSLFFK
ncbi:hypothetical protein C9374_006098 [Naegleria lovaniensis]|uniref:RGS domain-containing protein n=1 Tax=Naegleria lovaniensis TaxID=51637 RepID=A0AA88GMJ1_NAELO|nr:uncharacterized protein C9374_006098 [Naegleria lovaniensis]KAG2381714.1 hypothetical protein C9374_006098 [Naegleria lovaniensis]